MDKPTIKKAMSKARESSKPRKFKQSFDLIVNLQDLNLKNPTDQVEFFANLHYDTGRKMTVCALTGPELTAEAEKTCDFVIKQPQFEEYKDKRKAKKLAAQYDYFIAQANIMPQVATVFGRALGPRGKMPNPKAGCVVPANATLKPLVDRLASTVKISAKKLPIVQIRVGKEDQSEEEVLDNIFVIYDQLLHHLPKEKNNIKNAYLKLSMGKPVRF
ncbi:MAG: 50S ribosomal protein L1 [Nanoarchaeota archaeon]